MIFEQKYLSMLAAGNSLKYDEMLARFGLDPHKKEFWEKGLSMISDFIDELERLAD